MTGPNGCTVLSDDLTALLPRTVGFQKKVTALLFGIREGSAGRVVHPREGILSQAARKNSVTPARENMLFNYHLLFYT